MQSLLHAERSFEGSTGRSVHTAAIAVSAAIAVAALYFARDVLIPLTLAALLSFVLAPAVTLLRSARVPRVAAVSVVVALAVGLCVGIGVVMSSQLAKLADDLPLYEQNLREKIRAVRTAHNEDSSIEKASAALQKLGHEITAAPADESTDGVRLPAPILQSPQRETTVTLKAPVETPLKFFEDLIAPVLGPLTAAGLVLLFMIFILLQREDLRDRFIKLFGSRDLNRTTIAMNDAASRLSRYFVIQAALNSGFGVAVAIALSVIGVPSPVFWGALAAIMRFVPYIGSIVAAAFPIALAAAIDPGWSMAVMTALVFLIGEPVMGHIVEPLAYGRHTGLSPLAIVASATFWTWLWGPIGLILATPLTLSLVVLGQHVERFEFLSVLLGSEPALTPDQRFYQRLLAGDAAEVRQQALSLLKEQSLVDYYDRVALPGLRLALRDERHGHLDEERILEVGEAVDELFETLEDADLAAPKSKPRDEDSGADEDVAEGLARIDAAAADKSASEIGFASLPAAWTEEGAVLVLPGRGDLDQASAKMAAQLLRKAGFGAEVRGAGGLTGIATALGDEDVGRARRIIISTVGGLNPSQFRLLVRRAERALPGISIIIGVWAVDDESLDLAWIGKSSGASGVVTSFGSLLADLCKAARVEPHETRPDTKPHAPKDDDSAPMLVVPPAA